MWRLFPQLTSLHLWNEFTLCIKYNPFEPAPLFIHRLAIKKLSGLKIIFFYFHSKSYEHRLKFRSTHQNERNTKNMPHKNIYKMKDVLKPKLFKYHYQGVEVSSGSMCNSLKYIQTQFKHYCIAYSLPKSEQKGSFFRKISPNRSC